ncbi:MAG: helix-turn-helix domain-containing protein [Planctomycetaceae bacterium]
MARPRIISDEQILSAARECFFEHGPAVSTDVISERLGVSPQALFKRFHNKQGLLIAAIAPSGRAPWLSLVEAGPDQRTLVVQLTEILQQLADFFVDIARRMSVLRFAGINPCELLQRYDEAPPLVEIRALAGWLERAAKRRLIRRIDYSATAMLLLTSMHGPAMLSDMLGHHPTGHSREEYVKQMADLLIQGLKPRQSLRKS